MPMMMWNMTTFPIERLCFDLKLEVLEQLDARDVIELVKVNQGFQWMISSRPSIVFGHHVEAIEFAFQALNIKKLNWKSLEVSLDVIRDFPFIKNIRSCDELWVRHHYDGPIDKEHATFLKQFEAVNSLYLYWCSLEHLELLSHLSIKIKRYARISSFLQKAPSIKALVGHFIEAQLSECKRVKLDYEDDDQFHFYYNALIKTHSKYLVLDCYNKNIMLLGIQRIVSHGIPSKNAAAVVRIWSEQKQRSPDPIVAFLKGYPEMKQISRKNRQPLIALANERSKGSSSPALTLKTLCFRRNINATRDCIYMLSLGEFLAFYIKPDEMVDH